MAELSTLARPYAKAVFELARDGKSFAAWSKELAAIAAAVAHPAVAQAIGAPGVAKGEIAVVLVELLKSELSPQGVSLVKLLAENGRLEAAHRGDRGQLLLQPRHLPHRRCRVGSG